MTKFLGVVAVAAALVAAGCGGGGHSKRAAVTNYINRVNAVEKQLATRFAAITKTNQSFASGKPEPHVEVQLAASVRTMQTLSHRLAAIPAPPETAHLRTLLLELVRREVTLAREVDRLSTFVPAFQAALQPLAAADANLKATLGQTAKSSAATKALDQEKTSALEAYAGILDRVIAKLRTLQPPTVWQPGYHAQLASLDSLRSTARALAAAIKTNRAAALPALLQRFDQAAVSDQSTAAQKAQRAAVVAYNGRVKSVVALSRTIDTERGRLQGAYG